MITFVNDFKGNSRMLWHFVFCFPVPLIEIISSFMLSMIHVLVYMLLNMILLHCIMSIITVIVLFYNSM